MIGLSLLLVKNRAAQKAIWSDNLPLDQVICGYCMWIMECVGFYSDALILKKIVEQSSLKRTTADTAAACKNLRC